MNNMTSVGDIFNRTKELISWLVDKGITTANSSRVSEYEKLAREFWEVKDLTSPGIVELFRIASNSIFELWDLLEIKDVFQDEVSSAFWERLEKAHKGKTFVTCHQDGASRNFLFELMMAAFFAKKGYAMQFDSVADTVVSKYNITGYIECKKIYSIKKVEKNLKKAHRQLIQHNTKSNSNKIGIVAIDISHLIGEIMPLKEFENHLTAELAINESFKHIGKHIGRHVYNCNDEFVGTTLATIVHFSVSYWLENVSVFLFRHKEVTTSNFIGDAEFAKLNDILR